MLSPLLAEEEGLEPPYPCGLLDFESSDVPIRQLFQLKFGAGGGVRTLNPEGHGF